MACTCNKNNSTSKNRCNSCNDSGCLNFVYPKCILTETAYPCIGVGAGKTGTVLFAAIDSAICTLKNTKTVVEGCIQSVNGTNYPSIVVTPTVVGSTTTYKVCLSDAVIDFFVGVSTDIQTISNKVYDISGCVFDATGGCEINNLKIQITNIDNEIVTINNNIVDINNDIVNINSALSDASACLFDATGGCEIDNINTVINTLLNESWKTLGTAGTMENGEPIPSIDPLVITTQVTGRLRHHTQSYAEVNLYANVEVNNLGLALLFTLPIGYRPLEILTYNISCLSTLSTDFCTGFIRILTDGTVTLFLDLTPTPDRNFIVGWNTMIPLD